MLVDQIEIYAKAGDGGDGVVRWNRAKYVPKGGPAGGDGGHGGDVFVRAVRDLNRLAKYTGAKKFAAKNGEHGRSQSQFGKGSNDIYIDLPIGSKVTDLQRDRTFELYTEGETIKILSGGAGGRGNEHFKSSTNRAPEEATKGRDGEEGNFDIQLSLIADVGLVGLPNAGKSSLLNAMTNATSKVGSYQFTTLEPHLGSLFGYVLADIPGLIEGAHTGKGLGIKFLKHVERTKMLLHLVSLELEDPKGDYNLIKNELAEFNPELAKKEVWIVLTKNDLVEQAVIDAAVKALDTNKNRVFVISSETGNGIKNLQDALVKRLRES